MHSIMAVRPSVRNSRESRFNCSIYQNMPCTISESDVSSLLRSNFAILNLGDQSE